MGVQIGYYLFALFIAALVCIVAVVFKILFSNVKTQTKLLDERETQLLQTYNSVETIMEEFQDQAKATRDELKHREDEYRALVHSMDVFHLPADLEKRQQIIEKIPRSLPLDANRIKAAEKVIERAEQLIVNKPPPPQPAADYTQVPANTPVLSPAAAPVRTVSAPAPAQLEQSTPAATPEPKPPVFQKFFDEAADAPAEPASNNGASKKETILALASEGKTDVEIASTLGITRNEVQLVIGLTK